MINPAPAMHQEISYSCGNIGIFKSIVKCVHYKLVTINCLSPLYIIIPNEQMNERWKYERRNEKELYFIYMAPSILIRTFVW